MNAWEKEVGGLLESYRLSHEDHQSHSALDTSPKPEPQSASHSKEPTDVCPKKGNKRLAEEELEQEQAGENQDDEGRGHAKKEGEKGAHTGEEAHFNERHKRANVEGCGWQGFGEELELAGATMCGASVSFRFADTALPFRFKS